MIGSSSAATRAGAVRWGIPIFLSFSSIPVLCGSLLFRHRPIFGLSPASFPVPASVPAWVRLFLLPRTLVLLACFLCFWCAFFFSRGVSCFCFFCLHCSVFRPFLSFRSQQFFISSLSLPPPPLALPSMKLWRAYTATGTFCFGVVDAWRTDDMRETKITTAARTASVCMCGVASARPTATIISITAKQSPSAKHSRPSYLEAQEQADTQANG